jgi:hypothetical protein
LNRVVLSGFCNSRVPYPPFAAIQQSKFFMVKYKVQLPVL